MITDRDDGRGASSSLNPVILDQFPDVKEQLLLYCANMGSEQAASHEKEQKVKFLLNGVVQPAVQSVLQQVILGNEGTQIIFDFTVIECDQDIVQALVNCAATALMQSPFKLKCIPTAIYILIDNSEHSRVELAKRALVDPSLKQIGEMRQKFTHSLLAVCDSQKD
mmetsp:Transcript_11785/g.19891  ORF Transcript_11785/g.19891 Transcript_11785/m.19891 type:complete len:166 (-) Transcript_11785:188-685(-)